jgi:hypothetical protein
MPVLLQNYRYVGEIGEIVLQEMTTGQWYVERRIESDGDRWTRLYTGDEDEARRVYAAHRGDVD